MPVASSPDSGLYVLILRVDSSINVRVGAIGKREFRPGYYAYCGSARRGLSARLKRHSIRRKKKRWHIDYLTTRREVALESVETVSLADLTECGLNARIMGLPSAEPVRGFGCSDCGCVSHLAFLGVESPTPLIRKTVSHAAC